MGPKHHYDSIDDLYDELDHESLLDEEDFLDEDDLALLQGPKRPAAVKPTPKRKAPAKKPAAKKPAKKRRK